MKNILVVVLAFAVLGGIYYVLSNNNVLPTVQESDVEAGETNETGDMPDNSVSGMRVEENAVVTTEQKPGNTIKVAQVFLAESGYVVIHEDNNGAPGAILGSSAYLKAGQTDNISVPISRSTKDGEKLWSMLHVESNGDTSFEATSDVPVQSMFGGPLMGWFEILAGAEENIEVTL